MINHLIHSWIHIFSISWIKLVCNVCMCAYLRKRNRQRSKKRDREELERVLSLCGSFIIVLLASKIYLVGFNACNQTFILQCSRLQVLNFNSSRATEVCLQVVYLGRKHEWYIFYILLCNSGICFYCFCTWMTTGWVQNSCVTIFFIQN